MKEDLCKRCGACCYAHYGDKRIACPNLFEKEGKTWCRVYSHRLGSVIAKIHNTPIYCGMRENSTFDYPGCPYNTNKPIKQP